MSDFGNYKWVKTRKEHSCVYCGRTIPKGTKARNYSGMWDGYWQNWYCCGFCEKYIEPEYAESGEVISGEEFHEWLNDSDHGSCPKCKENKYSEWEWEDDNVSIRYTCPTCDNEWVVAIPFEVEVEDEPISSICAE